MQARLTRRITILVAVALSPCLLGCGSRTSISEAVNAANRAIEVKKKVNDMDADARHFMHKVIAEAEQKSKEGDFFLNKDKYEEAVQAYDQCAALYRQALDGAKLHGRLRLAEKKVACLSLVAELTGAMQEKTELQKAEKRASEYIEAGEPERAIAELETVGKAVFPDISKNAVTRQQAEAARDALQAILKQTGRISPIAVLEVNNATFAAVRELDNEQYALAQAMFQATEKYCRKLALERQKIKPEPVPGYAGIAFVVNPDGYLVTALHVVTGASEVTVKVGNNTYVAKIVAVDKANDLAVLKIDANALPFVPLEETHPVDNTIVTVFGSGLTVKSVEPLSTRTGKIVSGLDKDGVLNLDCPLNPGFTGGPVVTAQGNAIALVTAKAASVDVFHGSRAIPIGRVIALLRANRIAFTAGIPAGPFDDNVLSQRIMPTVAPVTVKRQASDGSVWNPTKPTLLWFAPWEHDIFRGRIAVSPDGRTVATARTVRGGKGEIELRDAQGNRQKLLTGHNDDAIGGLIFSHDGLLLASSSRRLGEIMLWNTRSGLLLRPLGDLSEEVYQITFSGDDRLLTARSTHHVRIWDVKTGQLLQTIPCSFFANVASGMAFVPGTETLLICGWAYHCDDNCISVYHARSGKCLRSITPKNIFPGRYADTKPGYEKAAGGDCNWIVLSPDGHTAAFYFHDVRQKIWLARTSDFRAFQEVSPLWQTESYSFSPDGTIFAIGGGVRLLVDAVSLYHVKTGALAWNLVGDGGRQFVFTPDGKGILRDGGDTLIRWNISFLGLGPSGKADPGALDQLLASAPKPVDPVEVEAAKSAEKAASKAGKKFEWKLPGEAKAAENQKRQFAKFYHKVLVYRAGTQNNGTTYFYRLPRPGEVGKYKEVESSSGFGLSPSSRRESTRKGAILAEVVQAKNDEGKLRPCLKVDIDIDGQNVTGALFIDSNGQLRGKIGNSVQILKADPPKPKAGTRR